MFRDKRGEGQVIPNFEDCLFSISKVRKASTFLSMNALIGVLTLNAKVYS